MLGAQNVNGRSQNTTDWFRAEVSHALRTGRRWVSGLLCDWRWNMGFSPHSWFHATVTAMAWRGSKGMRQTSMTRGHRSWFQDLINVWAMPATMLKNKVMYRQFIHSVAFVNSKFCTCLRPLYLYCTDTPSIRRADSLFFDAESKRFSVQYVGVLLLCCLWTTVFGSGYYEGWNFNSGNYLFTTDTK